MLNATFNNIYIAVILVEYTEKPTDLSQVTEKTLSHNVVHLAMSGIRIPNIDRHRLHG
jgi:hypothetical protein